MSFDRFGSITYAQQSDPDLSPRLTNKEIIERVRDDDLVHSMESLTMREKFGSGSYNVLRIDSSNDRLVKISSRTFFGAQEWRRQKR
ncbi:hypothetical protein BH20ACI3_BH20ACI3_38050 [soil metagenome]